MSNEGGTSLPEDPMLYLEPPLTAWPTPLEFEKYVYRFVKILGRDVKDLRVEHLDEIEGTDGSYTFDVTARFRGFGQLEFLCLFECKRHKRPIERGAVQELWAKMQSVGAQKGIMVSTAGFQRGAIKLAKVHGIATMQLHDQILRNVTNSVIPSTVRRLPLVRGRYETQLYHDHCGKGKVDVAELHPDLIRQALGLPVPERTLVHEDACQGCGEIAYLMNQGFRIAQRDVVIQRRKSE